MIRYRCRGSLLLCLLLLIVFLVSRISIEFTPLFLGAAVEQREYEVERFDENLTIQPNNLRYVTYNLEKGEEFEIINTVQVKEGLPIDIWFMNENNYLLFVNDAQFLYFIDGSEQQVIYTKKIITIKEPDVYVLVMTNYNNQTTEVNIICEVRTYLTETSEPSSLDQSIFFYLPLLAVIILVVLLAIFIFKTLKFKRGRPNASHNASAKKKARERKAKKNKVKISNRESIKKTKKHKVKKVKPKVSEEETSMISEVLEPKQTESEVPDKASNGFCGYCGKPVDTPYCRNCGRKISNS